MTRGWAGWTVQLRGGGSIRWQCQGSDPLPAPSVGLLQRNSVFHRVTAVKFLLNDVPWEIWQFLGISRWHRNNGLIRGQYHQFQENSMLAISWTPLILPFLFPAKVDRVRRIDCKKHLSELRSQAKHSHLRSSQLRWRPALPNTVECWSQYLSPPQIEFRPFDFTNAALVILA